ncbi:MAG TPA: hypothetical protein VFD43_03300 [Planctomycetota bacterium]|nr:hypothetical protein [Planctomycetota bacterium]
MGMNGSWCAGLVLGVAAAVMAAATGPAADAGPCVLLTGADSAIREPRIVLVTTADQWAALWLEHRGLPERVPYDTYYNPAGLPEIDFATHAVVGVFDGEGHNCAGLRTEALVPGPGETTLRYSSKSYQTLGEAEPTRPYGFFVLPRPAGALQVEEQLYSMAGPSRIEPRASFPAPR